MILKGSLNIRWTTNDFSRSVDLVKNLSPQYVTLRKCSDSSLKSSFMQLINDVACTVNIYNYGSCTGHK